MILAGDVGGTKALLALFDPSGRSVREQIFHCAEWPSFEAIVEKFAPGKIKDQPVNTHLQTPIVFIFSKDLNQPTVAADWF